MLADNRLAENAGWDREILALELGDLQVALPEIGLEVGITGFDAGDIDSIMVTFRTRRPIRPTRSPPWKTKPRWRRTGIFLCWGVIDCSPGTLVTVALMLV